MVGAEEKQMELFEMRKVFIDNFVSLAQSRGLPLYRYGKTSLFDGLTVSPFLK
jgi:hypothetical protein